MSVYDVKRVAFFDLDETLISCKSLFEIFKFYCEHSSLTHLYLSVTNKIHEMINNQVSRNEINRFFYGNFLDLSQERMSKMANEWFLSKLNIPNFFCNAVIDKLHEHQAHGDLVVIVSGSFLEGVAPIAHYLNIEECICTQLESQNGVYTGKMLDPPLIGSGKKEAIESYLQEKRLNLLETYAYADHYSDLPMLLLADYPTVVGEDQYLVPLAMTQKWQVLNRFHF